MNNKETKQKYFDKIYEEAPLIPCGCGCGQMIKSKDKYGRDKKFINGHNGRKYEDKTQYKREWNHRNREARYLLKKNAGKDRKIKLIGLKGNECSKCGLKYDGENECVFDFHHLDPSKKKMGLNQRIMFSRSWESILEEAEKCVLLCSNCHRLEHRDINTASSEEGLLDSNDSDEGIVQ